MNRLTRWLASTPNRTFIVYPILVVAVELARGGGTLVIVWWGVPLLVWGYLQYRLVGRYRIAIAKGSPGMQLPPERLVDTGPYRYVRNPMYLGHLIFMSGLAVTLWSWPALLLLAGNAVWFHRRVLGDEARLVKLFGGEFVDYQARVKRWIPGLL